MTNRIERPDPWVTLLALFVTVVGVLAIWDAGYSRAAANGQIFPREMMSQTAFGVVALILGVIASRIDRAFWQKSVPWIAVLGLGLMLCVELPGIGKEINFARRWIGIGNFTVQPAEFIKLTSLFAISYLLCNLDGLRIGKTNSVPQKIDAVLRLVFAKLWPVWIIAGSFFLLEKQKDLGTAGVIIGSILAVLSVSRVNAKVLVALIVVVVVGGVGLVSKEGYRANRISNHLHRWEKNNRDNLGYQTTQSEIALARGGLLGVGFGNGRAKHNLPAPTTDFVLATVAEEFGLVGASGCIVLLGLLAMRLVSIGLRSRDLFSRYVHIGVGSWIALQTVVNVAMVNGTVPPIGVPLPFITCGGSSLIALWVAVGVCQSLQTSKKSTKESADETVGNGWRNGRTRLSGA